MGPIIELWVRPVGSDQVLVRADINFSNYLDRFAVELFDHLNSAKQSQNVTVLTRWLFRQRASGLLFLDVLNSSSRLCPSTARAMVMTRCSTDTVPFHSIQQASWPVTELPKFGFGRRPKWPWHGEIFRQSTARGHEKLRIQVCRGNLFRQVQLRRRDDCDISVFGRHPWRVTAELNEMVQYSKNLYGDFFKTPPTRELKSRVNWELSNLEKTSLDRRPVHAMHIFTPSWAGDIKIVLICVHCVP